MHRWIWNKISPQDTEVLLYYTEGLGNIEASRGERSAFSAEAREGQDAEEVAVVVHVQPGVQESAAQAKRRIIL